MRNLFLKINYVGTNYNGFQSQPQKNTIEDKLKAAIEKLTGEKVKIISSGRTDAGVHARGQVCNFHTSSPIPEENWCMALNTLLPHDIVVLEAKEVATEFHARRFAKRKTYRYTINPDRFIDVFQRGFQLHHPGKLEVESMIEALDAIVGAHDFTSFCSVRTDKLDRIRTIFEARLEQADPAYLGAKRPIHIYISGSGFLYNMVRIIAGTLIQVGEGKRSSQDMRRILDGKNRALAGPTAPSHGLILWSVEYD